MVQHILNMQNQIKIIEQNGVPLIVFNEYISFAKYLIQKYNSFLLSECGHISRLPEFLTWGLQCTKMWNAALCVFHSIGRIPFNSQAFIFTFIKHLHWPDFCSCSVIIFARPMSWHSKGSQNLPKPNYWLSFISMAMLKVNAYYARHFLINTIRGHP